MIKGFTASVDLGTVGRGLDAFIDVRLMPNTDPEKFEKLMKSAEDLNRTSRRDLQELADSLL